MNSSPDKNSIKSKSGSVEKTSGAIEIEKSNLV